MEISLINQASTFLVSVILGVFLSFLFDLFRALNASFKLSKKKVLINDIIYFVVSAVITFMCILIINLGEVRIYIIIGEILGFIVYRITLSRFIFNMFVILMNFLRNIGLRVSLFIKKNFHLPKIKLPFKGKNVFTKLKRKNVLKNDSNV